MEWLSVQEGYKIIMHYHAVNHDEEVFGDDATRFDIHRKKRMPSSTGNCVHSVSASIFAWV